MKLSISRRIHKPTRSLVLLTALAWEAGAQQAPPLGKIAAELSVARRARVEWAIGTNALPASLPVFKVVRGQFSRQTIDALMELGRFTESHRLPLPPGSPLSTKSALRFQHPETKAYLVISPEIGSISYLNLSAVHLPYEKVAEVPSTNETLAAAQRWLPKLGIDPGELARRPGSDELHATFSRRTRSRVNPKAGTSETKLAAHSVFLPRQKGGITFSGLGHAGGFYLELGCQGVVGQLSLQWRSLQPVAEFEVATTNQLTEWLHVGKGFVQGDWNGRVEKMIVRSIAPHYLELDSTERQETVLPYAVLKADVECDGQKRPLTILLPVITGEKTSRSRP